MDIRRILLPAGFSGVRDFGCLHTGPAWSALTVKKYFCDVGYGGFACVRAALMEPGAVTHTDFGSFYFERECAGWLNFWHKGEKNREKSGIKIFMVAEFPSAPVDFAPANQAMCSPGAMFL